MRIKAFKTENLALVVENGGSASAHWSPAPDFSGTRTPAIGSTTTTRLAVLAIAIPVAIVVRWRSRSAPFRLQVKLETSRNNLKIIKLYN